MHASCENAHNAKGGGRYCGGGRTSPLRTSQGLCNKKDRLTREKPKCVNAGGKHRAQETSMKSNSR